MMSFLGPIADSLLSPPRARTGPHGSLPAPAFPTPWVDTRQRDPFLALSLSRPSQPPCLRRCWGPPFFLARFEAFPAAAAFPRASSVAPTIGAPEAAGQGRAPLPEASAPEASAAKDSAPEALAPKASAPEASTGRASGRGASTPRVKASAGVNAPAKGSFRRAKDFQRALEALKGGKIWTCQVERVNNRGALLRFGAHLAFLPFSHLWPRPGVPADSVAASLVGTVLKVKVIEVDESAGRLIVSERKAQERLRQKDLVPGHFYDGEVLNTADYGVFVKLLSAEGSDLGVSGLVHRTELSWDAVKSPAAFVSVGQKVRVKLLRIRRGELALSIKQVDKDPLLSTLDSLLPISAPEEDPAGVKGSELKTQPEAGFPPPPRAAEVPWAPGAELLAANSLLVEPLPGLLELCESLKSQEGVTEVSFGREALEPRAVSQDLELWLSNVPVKDGQFTLVARAGRQVQEVLVTSTLDREGMKGVVLAVTDRIV